MTAYLGNLGSLFPVAQHRGGLGTTVRRESTEKRLLSGALHVQVAREFNRSWACDMPGATPDEYARFRTLVYGTSGAVPWAFVPVDAPYTNVMTAAGSMPGRRFASYLGDADPIAGFVTLPGIPTTQDALASAGSWVVLGQGTPVIPGVPVTGSVYLRRASAGNAQLDLTFYTAGGSEISRQQRTVYVGQTAFTRHSVTAAAAPPLAASVRLTVTGANTIALPSITWTTDVRTWVPGVSAGTVFIDGWDSDLTVLSRGGVPVESFSFTVTEVGASA